MFFVFWKSHLVALKCNAQYAGVEEKDQNILSAICLWLVSYAHNMSNGWGTVVWGVCLMYIQIYYI